MKKTLFYPIALFCIVLSLGNFDGALPENTGAPGELTCGRAPCHNVPVNVGAAQMSIEFSGEGQQYLADSAYLLTVKVSGQQTMRNGFQILALNEDNQNAGTWELLEPDKMKIISGIGLPNRRYVTHRAAGNLQTEWTMEWKAPPADAGAVTFYASVNATNNNGLNTGDEVYTSSIAVGFAEPNAAGIQVKPVLKIYPTLVREGFWIECPQGHAGADISVFSSGGKPVLRKKLQGGGSDYVETNGLPPGVYIILLENAGQRALERFIVF